MSIAFRHYLALGDSILSDDYPGPGQGGAALLYANRDELFPDWRDRDLKGRFPHLQFHQRTRSGFTCPQVVEVLTALPALAGPVLVILTVGGNALMQALSGGQSAAQAVAWLAEQLPRLLDHIRSRFPEHRLLLGNVYDPTDGTGLVQSSQRRGAPPQLAAVEGLALVNRLLADQGAQVVDLYSHFQGHGVRHADPTYSRYHPEDPSGWFTFDIEPNARGASEVRRCFWEALFPLRSADRPLGLGRGEIHLENSFFEPLPASILDDFEGR